MKAIKQIILKAVSLLCAVMFLLTALINATYAWDNQQQVTNNVYGTKTKLAAVELYLYEKEIDEGEIAVQDLQDNKILIPNAVFYLFKEDGTQIGGRYVTDQNGNISVSLPVGNYYFEEITPNIAYTFDVDGNGERIIKYPFAVTEQDELVIVDAYNIRLKGDLLIRKTVENGDDVPLTAEQLQTAFTFTVKFSDGKAYSYRIDGGEPQTVQSGETLTLCHGQTAEFENLPLGLFYEVVETPCENYVLSSSGNSGNITTEQAVASFVNTYYENSLPEGITNLTVTKQISGEVPENDLQRDFAFILTVNGEKTEFTLKSSESKIFELPIGANYTLCENDYFGLGFACTIQNGCSTVTELPIEATVTNTYVGDIKTVISGTKTWDMGEYTDVTLPDSITLQLKNGDLLQEEITVTPDENGLWNYSAVLPKYNPDGTLAEYTITENDMANYRAEYNGYDILNTYVAPVTVELPQITKTVSGENAPESVFEFALQGSNGVPMPEGANGSQKTFTRMGSGTLDTGNITFTKEGVYTYTVYELNKGEKGWKYDTSTYTVTCTVTEQNYALVCVCDISQNGKATDNIVFANTYTATALDKTVDISGTKTWEHGTNPESRRPDSIIVCLYADGELTEQRLVTEHDNWQYTFTMPVYDKNGDKIKYTIDEEEVADYTKKISGYDLKNTYVELPAGATAKPPKTGDTGNITLWFILMFVSGMGLIAIAVRGKKRSAYKYKHAKHEN